MADTNVMVKMRLRGVEKVVRSFEGIGRAVREMGRALGKMPTALDMVYYRAVDKAVRRSRVARDQRTRHGRQHRTRQH